MVSSATGDLSDGAEPATRSIKEAVNQDTPVIFFAQNSRTKIRNLEQSRQRIVCEPRSTRHVGAFDNVTCNHLLHKPAQTTE